MLAATLAFALTACGDKEPDKGKGDACGEGEPIDGCLNVRAVGPRPPASGYAVPPGESGTAWLRLDGRLLLLAGERDWGPRVRRLVPYASWLQGLPLLHAAAVEADGVHIGRIQKYLHIQLL